MIYLGNANWTDDDREGELDRLKEAADAARTHQ